MEKLTTVSFKFALLITKLFYLISLCSCLVVYRNSRFPRLRHFGILILSAICNPPLKESVARFFKVNKLQNFVSCCISQVF